MRKAFIIVILVSLFLFFGFKHIVAQSDADHAKFESTWGEFVQQLPSQSGEEYKSLLHPGMLSKYEAVKKGISQVREYLDLTSPYKVKRYASSTKKGLVEILYVSEKDKTVRHGLVLQLKKFEDEWKIDGFDFNPNIPTPGNHVELKRVGKELFASFVTAVNQKNCSSIKKLIQKGTSEEVCSFLFNYAKGDSGENSLLEQMQEDAWWEGDVTFRPGKEIVFRSKPSNNNNFKLEIIIEDGQYKLVSLNIDTNSGGAISTGKTLSLE